MKKSKDIQNSKFKIQNSSGGFTLIEVLIVVLIVSAILSIAITSGRNFNDSVNLENTAKGINSKIKLAKSRSVSALNGTNHSVHFEADKITVFEGSIFNVSASTNEVFTFSDDIGINIPTGLSGGDDLIFDRLVGSTINTGNIDIEVISDSSKTKQIIVNSDGQTSLNSFQTSAKSIITNARHVHFHLNWNIKDATTLSLEWVDPDNLDSHIVTEDIDIATYLNSDQSVFDWTGSVTVDSVDQKMRIDGWLVGVSTEYRVPNTDYSFARIAPQTKPIGPMRQVSTRRSGDEPSSTSGGGCLSRVRWR